MNMLRPSLGILQRQVFLTPRHSSILLPLTSSPTICTRRWYASAKGGAKTAPAATGAAGKKPVREAPKASSNKNRKWLDPDWKRKQKITQRLLKKKSEEKKGKVESIKRKKDNAKIVTLEDRQYILQKKTSTSTDAVKVEKYKTEVAKIRAKIAQIKHTTEVKKVKVAKVVKSGERQTSQSPQTIMRYDREEHRKKRKDANKEDSEEDIRDGDFLFYYGRFNLGDQGLNRLVSVHVREAMWRLYDADPDFWTPARLGTKFGFSLELTLGIVLMGAYEQFVLRRWDRKVARFHKEEAARLIEAQKVGKRFYPRKRPVNHMLSDELELGMGDEFGWAYTEGIAPAPPGGFNLFSDIAMVGDQLDMGLLARAAFKVAPPPHELPDKPPPIYIPGRLISGPTRANKLHRARLLVMDIDKTRKGKMKKNVRDDQRFMMIRELDGSLRTPSWKERLNIQENYMHHYKVPFHVIARDPLAYYNTHLYRKYTGKH